MAQRFVEAMLFYHPAGGWVSARIRLEREHCCDDLAVRLCGDRLIYAEALLELERGRESQPGFSVAASGVALKKRIQRILETPSVRYDWQPVAAIAFTIVLWIVIGVLQSAGINAAPRFAQTSVTVASSVKTPQALMAVTPALSAIAAIVTAQQTPAFGTIRGKVVRTTGEPLANVQVTLANGHVVDAVRILPQFLETLAIRGTPVLPSANGAITDRQSLQALVTMAASRGIAMDTGAIQSAVNSLVGLNQMGTVSDQDGAFTISDVPAGLYTINARREGYFGVAINGTNPLVASSDINVSAGQPTAITIPMAAGGVISGEVRDASNQPISNINVQAFVLDYQNGYPVLAEAAARTTDDHGYYRLFWLSPGDYYLAATPRLAGTIGMGTVSTPTISVKTFYPGVSVFNNPSLLTMRGQEISGVNLTIQTARPVKVTGKVISEIPLPPPQPTAGNPVAGANSAALVLLRRDVNAPEDVGSRTAGTANLDPVTGDFQLSNILPGAYDLYARVNDLRSTPPFAWARLSLDVSDQDISGVVLDVRPSVQVRGTVLIDGRASGRIASQVALRPDGSAARLPGYQGVRLADVNEDGSFTVSSVPPGTYHVELFPSPPRDTYIADVVRTGGSVYDSGFEVAAEAPPALQIILKSQAATVEGNVRDRSGKAVVGATIALIPKSRQNPALYRTAVSDSAGYFTLGGMSPDSYKLFAWDSIKATAYRNAGFMDKYEAYGKAVELQQGATKTELTVIETGDR